MSNVSVPTKQQWKKIATAGIFSFLSGFLATLTAQGGFQVGLGWEGVISLVGGSLVAGFNLALYTVYVTFFKEGQKMAETIIVEIINELKAKTDGTAK